MLRGRLVSRALWALAGASACGRVGFQEPAGELLVPAALQGTAECGVAQKFFPLSLDNPSEGDVVITKADVTGGFTVLDPLPIVIGAGETGAVTVRAPLAVIGTDRGGDTKLGTLTLTTTGGTYEVALSADVIGANLDITTSAGDPFPLTLTFSGAQCPPPITGTIRNSGNTAATIDTALPSQFRWNIAAGVNVASGQSASFGIRPFTNLACTGAEALTMTTTGKVCTTTPVVLQASFTITGTPNCSCT